MSDNAIEKRRPDAIDRPVTDPAARTAVVDELEAQVLLIQEAMSRTLVKGVHYGTIPGTPKPSLWQPGAEMLCQMFRFQTDLTRTGEHEDWDKGVFSYTYKCRLMNRQGELITEREGTCSSKEPNYASKNAFQIRETLMQMAQKRAYVAAVRGAGAASAIFSQDDDIVPAPAAEHGTCAEHGVPYFKTEKMRSAAHRIDGGGWCNKPDTAPVTPPERKQPDWMTPEYHEAADALKSLFDDGDQRLQYVKDVIGREVDHPNEVTAVEWVRVKQSAVEDAVAMAEGDEQQLDF